MLNDIEAEIRVELNIYVLCTLFFKFKYSNTIFFNKITVCYLLTYIVQ